MSIRDGNHEESSLPRGEEGPQTPELIIENSSFEALARAAARVAAGWALERIKNM